MKEIQDGIFLGNMDTKQKTLKIDDSELESVLTAHKTVIKVVGSGGAGNNTLTRLSEVGVKGIDTIAVNTDAQDLLFTKADNKLLIGRDMTNGLGAGSNPKIGEDSALENQEEIKAFLEGSDMVFVTCGLGGGTGTGSAPIIADIAKAIGALTIAVVTLPFTEEGALRWQNAMHGLDNLRESADTVIVVQNDRLLDIVPDLPLNSAFKIADEILVNAVKGITELVTEKGLVNLDFADVKSIMRDGDTAMIGIGESNSENRANDAVEKAVMNPLLDVDITGAKSALINVSGDENMSIREARSVMITIAEKLDPEAKIIWGARIDEELQGSMRVLLIATGLKQSDESDKKSSAAHKFSNKADLYKDQQLFDIKETKDIKLETQAVDSKKNDGKKKKKTKKVFTEIFEEEIKGDLNILKESVKNIDGQVLNEKTSRNILKACTSLQSSAQLFSYDKIEEFTIFIADVMEGILSGNIAFSDKLAQLFPKIPLIVEGMVNNNKVALPEAQEFINNLTRIIDNSYSGKKKVYLKSKKMRGNNSTELFEEQDGFRSKFQMEVP